MYLKETLEAMRQKVKTSFHVPGHHFGSGCLEYWKGSLLDYDFTELNGTDNLQHPTEAIHESQKRIAKLYGSDYSYLLVNGTTVGILASLYALVRPNDLVLVQREVHQSVINGVELAQGRISFMQQRLQADGLCFSPLTPVDFEKAIQQNPSCKVVVLTYPNYYGCGCNIKIMVEIAHKYDKIVVVDSAHGSHFLLNDAFPECPVNAGADVVVQSAHKTLHAMTQGSWMHIQGTRVNHALIERALRVLQSSSPSYVLMTSLDIAAEIMESKGDQLAKNLITLLDDFYSWAEKTDIKMMESSWDASLLKDPSRICIDAYSMGVTGYELGEFLETQGIYTELQTSRVVVLVTTLASTREDFTNLKEALLTKASISHEREILERIQQDYKLAKAYDDVYLDDVSTVVYNLSEVRFLEDSWVSLDEAEGKILTMSLTPYPPGVPMCLAGSRLQKHQIELMKSYITDEQTILGVEFKKQLACVRVAIKEC